MKLKATRAVLHNGKLYEADAELDVADKDQAAALLQCGACVEAARAQKVAVQTEQPEPKDKAPADSATK